MAGRKAVFDVSVLQASKRIVPEVTDEFANKVRLGLTADDLMKELQKAIDQEDSKEFLPARNKALSEALAEVMEVEVPDTLVTNQARERFAVMMADMRDNGVADEEIKRQINPENFNKYKEIVRDSIVRDFKVSMATDEIARLENIQVPDYQVQEQLEAIKKDAAKNKEEIDEKMLRAKVETTLQRQAVFDWLAERAQLDVTYEDEQIDEELLVKLAEESLEREKKLAEGKVDEVLTSAKASAAAAAAPVEDAPAPAAVEAKMEPAPAPTKTPEQTEAATPAAEDRAAKYAQMSLQDRAFQILKDTGLLPNLNDDDDDDE